MNYSMHPFGGLETHPFGGKVNVPGLSGNANSAGSVANSLRTSMVASAAMRASMTNMLKASRAAMQQGTMLAQSGLLEQQLATGGTEESFFEKYKTYILAGGAVAAVGLIALYMSRR
jgi:hypothetical protein